MAEQQPTIGDYLPPANPATDVIFCRGRKPHLRYAELFLGPIQSAVKQFGLDRPPIIEQIARVRTEA